MRYLLQTLVGKLLRLLQLPDHMVGDMDGIAANGQGGCDVRAERVADHQQLVGLDVEMITEGDILVLPLVGDGLHILEKGSEP